LDKAIQQYIAARTAAHQRFERDHDQAALDNKLLENIDLNRYLEEDYKNLVVYRAAAISKLKGGNPENYDPVSGLSRGFRRFLTTDGRLVLSDADSLIGDAQSVLRDLQELSSRLAQQVEQESKTN
jgi:hypothetical protein